MLRCISSHQSVKFALLCLILFAGLASAQPFACVANVSVIPSLRMESATELTGDLVVTCTGGTSIATGVALPSSNFTISLNTGVTSRLQTVAGSASTEALLLIDEPGSASTRSGVPLACPSVLGCSFTGTGTGVGVYSGDAGRPNIFRGVVSGNQITFSNVPVDPPGTKGGLTGSRVFRFVNIRANASAVSSVIASVSISGSSSFPLQNSIPTLGIVAPGLGFSIRDGLNNGPLTATSITPGAGQFPAGAPSAILRFAESFATAAKTRTWADFSGPNSSPPPKAQSEPGVIYNSESGFTISNASLTVTPADFGTRFKAAFRNIPTGVNVFVATGNVATLLLARLTANETGPFSAITATGTAAGFSIVQVPLVNGAGTAVWEDLLSNPNSIDTFDFPIWFTGSSPVSVANIAGSLAPNSGQGAFDAAAATRASSTLPIPRFVAPVIPTVPTPVISAIVGGANSVPAVNPISANGFFTLYGTNFAPGALLRNLQASDIVNNSLPTSMESTCVNIGNTRAFLTFLSATQINAIAPALPATGSVGVTVLSGCGTANQIASPAFTVPLAGSSPEFLYWIANSDGRSPIIALDSVTGAFIAQPGLLPGLSFRAAKPGDNLTFYGISFGKTNSGGPVPGVIPFAADRVAGETSLFIGDRPAPISYLGVTPQSAGLYQLNTTVPTGLAAGNHPVVLAINGVNTPPRGFLTIVP